jgi:hypothetical protein
MGGSQAPTDVKLVVLRFAIRFRLSARVPPSPHAHARHRGLTRQVRLNVRTSALQGGRRPVCW